MFLSQKIKIKKGQTETSGGDGYVYDIDCGNGFTGVCLPQNSLSWYVKCVQLFVSQSKLNKV